MSLYIRTHIVQKGETIEDIVSQYNIPNVEMLRYFHNQNCPKDRSHIGSVVFAGQEIFIPEKTDIDSIIEDQNKKRKEKKQLEQNHLKNTILYLDVFAIKKQYRVTVENSKNGVSEKISFDVCCRYIDKDENNLPILEYKKGKYLINDKEPDTKLNDLALEAIQFLYPLEFSLEQNYAKPHIITNLKEIRKRWENLKNKIKNFYSDAYSLKYIKVMDESMNEGLSKHILNDLFLQFFFAPYVKYENGIYDDERNFHTYKIRYQDTMEMQITEDEIQIEQKAYCIDLRTPQQILSKWKPDEENAQEENEEVLESYIEGSYILDINDKILKEAKIELKTNFYEEEIIQVEINTIEI